jgi:cytosine/adenosine deaminase-related metal-dependent hydrolase
MTAFWCERAWVDGAVRAGVLVSEDGGVITQVSTVDGSGVPPGAHRLHGLVLPGMANAHSHAFHRALRGRTHGGGGTFWTWREAMYELAGTLDPDGYHRLARAVYAEMVLAGWTCVGEFHYLHHPPGGGRYADPNEMAAALRQAAEDASIRLTLLDACYLTGGIGQPVSGVQLRFSDGTVDAWARRIAALNDGPLFRAGAAIHSVRAVPASALPGLVAVVGSLAAAAFDAADAQRTPVIPTADALPASGAGTAGAARHATTGADPAGAHVGLPLHVHLSEQPAENEACLAAYGVTPTRLLHDAGALSARTTAVHATHLTSDDIALLGSAGAGVCPCPTTEADLADGIGPMRALADAGCTLSLGSDQHAIIDPFAEARGLEAGERLSSLRRGRFTPAELVHALTQGGYTALGWPAGGRIAPGAPADLVALTLDSPRTAGSQPDQAVLTATASDVHTVIVAGKIVARDGQHTTLGDVGRLLSETLS